MACECEDKVSGVSQDEIEELNAAVHQLSVDVNGAVDESFENCESKDLLGFCHDPRNEKVSEFQIRWTDFAVRWQEWFDDHQTFVSRQFIDPEFSAMRSEYNQKRLEFSKMGEASSAPMTVVVKNPFEEGLGATGEILKWGLIVGITGIVAYTFVEGYKIARKR